MVLFQFSAGALGTFSISLSSVWLCGDKFLYKARSGGGKGGLYLVLRLRLRVSPPLCRHGLLMLSRTQDFASVRRELTATSPA